MLSWEKELKDIDIQCILILFNIPTFLFDEAMSSINCLTQQYSLFAGTYNKAHYILLTVQHNYGYATLQAAKKQE